MNMEGKTVWIHTKHRLWGENYYKMVFAPYTEKGYGFYCRGQNIYVPNEELAVWVRGKDNVTLKSKDMEINILILS